MRGVEDRRGEYRLGQGVVVGRLRVPQGEGAVDAGHGGEVAGVVAGFGVGGEDVGAARQRVGDADRVVVGVEERTLVAVGGREFGGRTFAAVQ
ncbi:hypothetical protein EYS09_00375 [Streptomyces kasugaensis]|uniref:Uncharacterized protein n=1 Tax=Streptomyces kasugaensis TaxID=1946 RepID=A0A4Q9I3M4_STRKA|nr:hypothetical protein [Streptomyces kasugaensis]TBO61579.1 hypothetical protein EYS09_00375 [Streptomyces kasugaensis]